MKKTILAGLVVFAAFAHKAALAWDGAVVGTIAGIDSVASEPGNYETRVFISGQTTICTAAGIIDPGWGYLNSTDSNYKGTLAMLMLAYSMNKTVTVYTMKDGAGFCHIHYVVVR